MPEAALEPCQLEDRVLDVMTPKPITVTQDVSVSEVHALMHERRIRHVPVVDGNGGLVGIVSQRDLLSHSQPGSVSAPGLASLRIDEIMRDEVDTVTPECCAAEAARHMLRTKRGCLLVVDEAHRLVGIVTEADFVRLAVRGRPACSCGGVHEGG